MRERGIPEDWSAKASRLGDASGFPIPGTPDSETPNSHKATKRTLHRRSVGPNAPSSADWEPSNRLRRSAQLKGRTRGSRVKDGEGRLQPRPTGGGGIPPVTPQPIWRRWFRTWVFWALLAAVSSSGIGFAAVAILLKLPSAPNCPSIFWPLASATVRVHCAQVAANKQTVNDLLQAIALVKALPPDHPLRSEINNYLEEWSLDIVALGDESFQAGKLQQAIAIARKVPQDVHAYQLVEERIQRWQSIWSEAESIYKEAEAEMRDQHWHQAFLAAVRLLNVGNNYWATTKYEELNGLIETTREDANKLAKAERLARTGVVANLLEAIKLTESIAPRSYIYKDAQDAIPEFGRKMMDLAQATLERQNVDEAIAIARQIPASTSLQPEAQDFISLAEARRNAGAGTVVGLEGAILQAQSIGSDRPLYNKAQELISRWQLEIEDLTHLERARGLAQGGTIGELTSAIAEAQLIPNKNPRASEARQDVSRWRGQVETIEDRPYLDHAEQLATMEDITSLQAAINEASKIVRGRALYREAQRKIWTWTQKIERIQDQPYLDQARTIARTGDLTAAIAAAQQIQSQRALYSEAQATVRDWQGQLQARQNWQRARRIALTGTPEDLAEAIRIAERIPRSNPLRNDANPAMNQWSQQILSVAQDRGEYDIPGGIEIAKLVPPGTDAYQSAQDQIELWEKFLDPNRNITDSEE